MQKCVGFFFVRAQTRSMHRCHVPLPAAPGTTALRPGLHRAGVFVLARVAAPGTSPAAKYIGAARRAEARRRRIGEIDTRQAGLSDEQATLAAAQAVIIARGPHAARCIRMRSASGCCAAGRWIRVAPGTEPLPVEVNVENVD